MAEKSALVHLAHRPTPAAILVAPVPFGSPPEGVKDRDTLAGQVKFSLSLPIGTIASMVICTGSPGLETGGGAGVGEAGRRVTVKRQNPTHLSGARGSGGAVMSRPRSLSPSASGMTASLEPIKNARFI